jgi:outer membrane murein-binding lipoprotein Lpp
MSNKNRDRHASHLQGSTQAEKIENLAEKVETLEQDVHQVEAKVDQVVESVNEVTTEAQTEPQTETTSEAAPETEVTSETPTETPTSAPIEEVDPKATTLKFKSVRPGTLRDKAVKVMIAHRTEPMEKVLPMIAEAIDGKLPKARSFYTHLVKHGMAPGTLPSTTTRIVAPKEEAKNTAAA